MGGSVDAWAAVWTHGRRRVPRLGTHARKDVIVVEVLGLVRERAKLQRAVEDLDGKRRELVVEDVAKLEADAVAHVHQHLAPAREDLLERVRRHVERETRLDDEHAARDARVECLQARERRQEHCGREGRGQGC